MKTARRFIVSGYVQGVGYRYFARRAAEQCGVAGTVRNLPDGTVEAYAEGEAGAVAAFRTELERGPMGGRVERVAEEEASVAGLDSFRVIF